MRYTVTAERGSTTRRWVLQCVEVPGALWEVARLDQAEAAMREAIAYVAEVAPDSIDIDLRPTLPAEALERWHSAEIMRREADEIKHRAAVEARAAARLLSEAGLPVRDVGTVLGVSYQRAHQLLEKIDQ